MEELSRTSVLFQASNANYLIPAPVGTYHGALHGPFGPVFLTALPIRPIQWTQSILAALTTASAPSSLSTARWTLNVKTKAPTRTELWAPTLAQPHRSSRPSRPVRRGCHSFSFAIKLLLPFSWIGVWGPSLAYCASRSFLAYYRRYTYHIYRHSLPPLDLVVMSPSSPYWGTVMDMDSATNVQHGKRLMPVMVDEVAVETPDRVCFSIPRSADLRAGFHDITFQTVSFWFFNPTANNESDSR